MKQSLYIYLYLALIFFCPFQAAAQADTGKGSTPDSIRFSLLTCASGEEIYSLFGHTAIRYENVTQGIDVVFNYGMFSFNTPNFIFRFALGETDYQLGVSPYDQFAAEYRYLGRDVWQQTLNLRPEEKQRLLQLLEVNYQPENRVYRYNFFYDNCATRPRDQIEKAVNGTLQYAGNRTDTHTGITFRNLLHQYSQGHSWARFGIDLCIGSKADKPINRRLMMFIPFYVKNDFGKARIIDRNGQQRPLISEESPVVTTENADSKPTTEDFTPLRTALLLFIAVAAATLYGIRHQKTLWGLDLLLFATAGLAGCVLAFLTFFSQHPAVGSNYLLFIFHPYHLFCLPCIINKVRKRKKSRYMQLNLAVLTLFILLWAFIPQRIDLAILPLSLCLLIRSASNLILTSKKNG